MSCDLLLYENVRSSKVKFNVQNDLDQAGGKDFYIKARKDLKAFVSLWSMTGF